MQILNNRIWKGRGKEGQVRKGNSEFYKQAIFLSFSALQLGSHYSQSFILCLAWGVLVLPKFAGLL